MKILILGGTIFLGRHLVNAALADGHQVTLFNRGQHNVDLFPGIEKLRGDRDGDLAVLQGRQWDAVIDTCGYVPRVVGASAELLAGSVGQYTFISSISVYADLSTEGLDEESDLGILEDQTMEEITGESYGPLKVLCEQRVESTLPGQALIIRPGLIVGPHDPTDRFTYWPVRFSRGGEVLAPAPRRQPVQFIDVRDLAAWTIKLIESGTTGIFNATGPDRILTMTSFLESCQVTMGTETKIIWTGEDFLLGAGVDPWMELPLWVGAEEYAGMLAVSVDAAIKRGLTFRPLVETILDTAQWAESRPDDYQWRAGLMPERELELLTSWRE